MSKAFTREDDSAVDDSLAVVPEDDLAPGERNYVTPAGHARLQQSMNALESERAALVAQLHGPSPAASDRTRLTVLEARMRIVAHHLEAAEVVDPATQDRTRVRFGATVTVHDEEGTERRYRIGGIDEADPKRGWLSWRAPLARALLDSAVGDVVTFRSPGGGSEELEIIAIEYDTEQGIAGE